MLSIELKHSELHKNNMRPHSMQYRSHSAGKSAHASSSVFNRVEELKKIGEENKIILKKL
jgi:hypothetical protein